MGLATEEEVNLTWNILKSTGAFREGHFSLSVTGFHYDKFFQLPLALQKVKNARTLCVNLGRVLLRSGILNRLDKDKSFTLVGPTDAGIPVAFWTGEFLRADRILWAIRQDDDWTFRQFMEVGAGDQVIVVDDISFTGQTLDSLVKFILRQGAHIEAVAVIVDRREVKEDFGTIPTYSLLQVDFSKYSPQTCPLCRQGRQCTEVWVQRPNR
ncbi:hypothetical protein ISS37_10450 [candidate division KSB1 bacterium]|nr:hypothetical protein [candidate division KSB1 bacterium]